MTTTELDDVVLREHVDGVTILTLNRPDRLNAWNAELEDRYFDLLTEADDDPAVRAIVVTGAGRGFCAGADMDAVVKRSHGGPMRIRRRPVSYPTTIRKPVIAAINGGCAGLGLFQALLCDLRFAVSDAKITTAFSRRGIPSEFGTSWILDRLIGPSRAADLLLSGRAVTGEEAFTLGLVNQVFDTRDQMMSAAVEYGRTIAENCSPDAVAAIKEQLQAEPYRTWQESESDAVHRVTDSRALPDFKEGVAAFREKRKPQFQGLPPLERNAP